MFDSNRLLQRHPGDAAYRERRSPRAHALDSGRPDDAAEHVRKALNHVNHADELDARRLRRYLEDALEALSEAQDRDEDDHDADRLDEDAVTDPDGHGGPPRIRARDDERDDDLDDEEEFGPRMGDRRRRARDAMGEVPPRSTVSTRGSRSRVDHRRDFADRAQGGAERGADSRHGFDVGTFSADALLQRSGAR